MGDGYEVLTRSDMKQLDEKNYPSNCFFLYLWTLTGSGYSFTRFTNHLYGPVMNDQKALFEPFE
jgi:hypothetical protein